MSWVVTDWRDWAVGRGGLLVSHRRCIVFGAILGRQVACAVQAARVGVGLGGASKVAEDADEGLGGSLAAWQAEPVGGLGGVACWGTRGCKSVEELGELVCRDRDGGCGGLNC